MSPTDFAGAEPAAHRTGSPGPPATRREPRHRSLLVVCGLAALVLGLGNWMTGTIRGESHRIRLAQAALSTPTDLTAEEMEISRARVEFYRVVGRGGLWLMTGGAASMATGLGLRALRRGTASPRTRRRVA